MTVVLKRFLLTGTALLAMPFEPAIASSQISAVQVGLGDELTRVVVSLSDVTNYQLREEKGNNQLVLTFPESHWRAGRERVGEGWGLVRDYSVESMQGGGERVVLDLRRPVTILGVQTTSGPGVDRHALVLDLKPQPIGKEQVSQSSPVRMAALTSPVAGSATIQGEASGSAAGQGNEERLARLEALLLEQERLLQQQQKRLDRQRLEISALRNEMAAVPRPPVKLAQAGQAPVAPRPVAPRAPVAPSTEDEDDSKPTEPQSAQPVAPRPVAPQPAAQAPVAPRPRAPQPVAPQPVGPQPVAPQPVAPSTAPTTNQPVAPRQEQQQATPDDTDAPSSVRPDAERQPDELLLAQNGILLPPGRAQIEVGTSHSHFSSNRINIGGFTIFEAIVIGTIRVDQLDRDVLTNSATMRVGVLPRLQVEARVPYVYRRDDELLSAGTNDQRNVIVEGDGLGDIEGTISWQPLVANGYIPDTLTRVRVKSRTGRDSFEIPTQSVGTGGQSRLTEAPTGSGFISINPGVTAVWRSDPVAFFLSGGYSYNKSRKVGAFGKIDPGDTIDFSTGLNVSLSDRVSLNMTFVNQFTMSTRQNGIKTEGSDANDARVQLGASVGITPAFSLLASAGIGLTEESPDYTFGLSGSYSFDFGSIFGGD